MLNTVTIVGVGLIGGSFSLALKDQGLVKKVIGVSRSGSYCPQGYGSWNNR